MISLDKIFGKISFLVDEDQEILQRIKISMPFDDEVTGCRVDEVENEDFKIFEIIFIRPSKLKETMEN